MATVRPVMWMVAGGVGSLLGATLVLGEPVGVAVWAGMMAPLVAVSATWIAVVRVHRRDPLRVTAVMLHGFAAKAVFFLGYVALALRVFALDPIPFVVSFTGSFVALYFAVALLLQRLYVRGLNDLGAEP